MLRALTSAGSWSPITAMPKTGEQDGETKTKPGEALCWLWKYLAPHKAVFLPSLAALFLTAGLALVFPLLLKEIIGDPAEAWRDGVEVARVKQGLDENLKWMV
ncbi:MAG: hypothetical protein ACQKBU_12370, partial [Verrucomicrobiales bacterium]